MMLANKIDLPKEIWEASLEEAQEFCREKGENKFRVIIWSSFSKARRGRRKKIF